MGNVDLTHIDLKNPTPALIEEIVENDQSLVDRLYEFRTPEGTINLVNLSVNTPGIENLLIKFQEIHDDETPEIRLILNGERVFHIYDERGQRFDIYVQKGDLLIIPATVVDNFELTDKCEIQALRVFQTKDGWVAKPRTVPNT